MRKFIIVTMVMVILSCTGCAKYSPSPIRPPEKFSQTAENFKAYTFSLFCFSYGKINIRTKFRDISNLMYFDENITKKVGNIFLYYNSLDQDADLAFKRFKYESPKHELNFYKSKYFSPKIINSSRLAFEFDPLVVKLNSIFNNQISFSDILDEKKLIKLRRNNPEEFDKRMNMIYDIVIKNLNDFKLSVAYIEAMTKGIPYIITEANKPEPKKDKG